MERTILSRIKEEHQVIMNYMGRILGSEPREREVHYQELKKVLVAHMHSEEESIYKRLKNDIHTESAREVCAISSLEHHLIKENLQRLNFLQIESDSWLTLFKEFYAETEKHCADEEEILFTEAMEDFSRRELVEIGYEFVESRSEIQLP